MCSSGFCLIFYIVQIVFLMNYSEQQSSVINPDEVTSEKQIDVNEILKQFALKYYTKRFVDGQNLVVAPLFILRTFFSLHDAMDASDIFDLKSYAGIPQNVSVEQMVEIEDHINKHSKLLNSQKTSIESRLYYDASIGNVRNSLAAEGLKPISTNFTNKQDFCNLINDWIRSPPIRGTDDLVYDYDVNNETCAFLFGAYSINWQTQLKPSTEDKEYQGEKIKLLEGEITTRVANIDTLKAEVVELTCNELAGIKLWLIKPDKRSSIKELNDQLNVASIRQIENELTTRKQDVSLAVPMVTIEFNSQEDAYATEVFEVFSSLFTKPSVKLVEGKDDLYPIKNFFTKCILRFVGSDITADSKDQSTGKMVSIDEPFIIMLLSREESVPLVLANYFSPTDKLRALEAMERRMKAAAKEHVDL